MKTSKNGINLIKNFEGCRLEAYKCPAGVWTIGYGHTAGVKQGQKITKFQADALLIIDLEKFEKAVTKLVKKLITQNEFDALVSFTFNVGIGNFEKSTLLRLINMGQFELASKQFERWIYASGKPLNGLKKRRLAEKTLFLSK